MAPQDPYCRRCDASDLERHARSLVQRLGGRWTERGGLCLCPAHQDHVPSLSIRLGTSALLFKCFAGCDQAEVMYAIGALDRNAGRLRMAPSVSVSQARSVWLAERVRTLWAQARPVAGSIAETYLRARGISHFPPALRFHPRTPFGSGPAMRLHPALLAGIADDGAIIAIERTYLPLSHAMAGHRPPDGRRLLGAPLAGSVRLARADKVLGLAEGIESALAASMILHIPVWAALGAARMGQVRIADTVSNLLVLADRDHAGESAVKRCLLRYPRPGLTITPLWPPQGHGDWNDLLRAGGKEDWERARLAAWRSGGLASGDPSCLNPSFSFLQDS